MGSGTQWIPVDLPGRQVAHCSLLHRRQLEVDAGQEQLMPD